MKKLNNLELSEENGISYIFLNRPPVRNALNAEMVRELISAVNFFAKENDTRVIIISGRGKAFCAGADMNWLREAMDSAYEQNYTESYAFTELMYSINECPKPVISAVNGAAIGGGAGIAAASDIVIASDESVFGLSEVRIGLVPAAIAPFIIKRIGEARAKEIFLTGRRIKAIEAKEIGLVNITVQPEYLVAKANAYADMIIKNGPEALAHVKRLIIQNNKLDKKELMDYMAKLIAGLRTSREGREGVTAFLEKRPPEWG
ncbi:MAG: enoyl-CoA hydratase-related protein [Candidatus Kapaibacterium sp.]